MKDINQLLEDFSEKFICQDKSIKKEFDDIFEYYSTQIGSAIQPLNAVSVPFIYKLLTGYAKVIAKNFPEQAQIFEGLEDMYAIVMEVPHKKDK